MGTEYWVEAPLSQLLESLESGSRPKGGVKGIAKGIPSIGAEHLASDGGFNFENIRYIPEDFANSMNRGQIRHFDILVVKDGATTGKTSFVQETFPFPKACVNEHVFICRGIKVTSKEFLFHYLKSHEGQEQIMSTFHGAAQGGISSGFADVVIVPLPPLPEQKRIVKKLDTILPKVKNAKSRLEKIPRILKRFRQSVLAAACSGKLTENWREENDVVETAEDQLRKILDLRILDKRYKAYLAKINDLEAPIEWAEEDDIPSSWVKSKLGVVCPKITDGTHDTPKRLKEGVPYITGKHIRERVIDFEHCDYVSSDDHKVIYARCNPNKNDVLMVNIGAGTATPSLVKVDYEFSMKNVALLKADPSIISGSYLEYYQLRYKDYIFNQVTKGGAQPFLSLDAIKALPIHLPPPEEQQEIVRRVEKLFKLADSIEAKYNKAIERVEKIEQSVLAKAFRGELTPQDPNDEPAEELLKRILVEKAKLEAVKKKSKRFSPQRNRHC